MVDVFLVNMPYVALERPSIALGLLAAILERDGLTTETCYANLQFADRNTWVQTGMFSDTAPQHCLGDWTFARSAFPDYEPDDDAFLAQACRKYGHDDRRAARLREILLEVREDAERFIEDLAAQIAALNPRMVGCTSTFQQHVSSLALLRRLRAIAPGIVTMLGGANCEASMGLVTHRRFDWVDFVVSGEADGFISDLCRNVLEHGAEVPLDRMPAGVFGPRLRRANYPGINGVVPRAVTNTIQGMPPPVFDSYFTTLEKSTFRGKVIPALTMETSRGCWWGEKSHCTFCGLNGNGMGFRSRSHEEVSAELSFLSQRHGLNKFEIVDNILDMKYFHNLLPNLAAQGGPYRLFYELKSNLSRDQVKLLRDAGVTWVQPGIESLHTEILQLMGKGVRASTNVQLLKWSREFGIRLSWSVLYSFPLEKDSWYVEMAKWLPLICHLQAPCCFNPVRIDRYSPYHSTPERYGLKLLPGTMYQYIYPVKDKELADLVYFFNYEGEPDHSARSFHREDSPTPGIDAVGLWILEWQRLFWKELRILCMTDCGDELHILDTRPCASERSFRLRGLQRQVMIACDNAPPVQLLSREVIDRYGVAVDAQALSAAVRELKERNLLLELDGRLINLAVAGDLPPLPVQEEFPGGIVLAMRERQSVFRSSLVETAV